MNDKKIIQWLLEGDPSIRYQTYRDLLEEDRKDIQSEIYKNGWGANYLDLQTKNGHWGQGFYQPKWISSHYTLLDLRNLCIQKDVKKIQKIIKHIASEEKGDDGGVNPARTVSKSDVCINGMFLNYATYFKLEQELLESIIDYILDLQMEDGGFNCMYTRSGAVHSSLHSTLSVLEGFTEYEKNAYSFRILDVLRAKDLAKEFILLHQLYISDRTGRIINPAFLRMPYPYRWRFDILRALDYFRYDEHPYDPRMKKALDYLVQKKTKEGLWKLNAKYPGQQHFEMEKAGIISRWNTLRVKRIFKYYQIKEI